MSNSLSPDGLTVNAINGGQIGGNRNLIINGAMQVAQRGTSSTGQGASDLFLVDRFHLNTNGNSAGRFTVTQESDGPSGIPNSLKLACTTADTSIAASERFFIEQRLEGQDCQRFKKGTSDAEAITVSFYVKGNAAATYVVGIYDSDNSRQIGAQFSVTTSWNRVSVTFPADTGGSALDDDNAESLSLRFYLHAGSTYTGGTLQTTWDTAVANEQVGSGTTSIFDSTSRTFSLTGVQLEVGEQATPFEHEPYGVTLQKAKRYYQRWDATASDSTSNKPIGAGVWNSATQVLASFTYDEMRVSPTFTASSTDFVKAYGGGFAEARSGGNGLDTIGTKSARFNFTVTTSRTAGHGTMIQMHNAGEYLELDAEL
jgi:hypothetical protein